VKHTGRAPRRRDKGKVGIPEIADLAKVSIGTVDRALHARKGVSEDTRKRILEIAKHVGYTPNLAARTLSMGRASVKIGVAIPREPRIFYDQLQEGIIDEGRRLESMGVQVIYQPIDKLGAGEYERLKEMLNTGVNAVIITPGDPHCLNPLIDEAEARNIRVICVASDAPGSTRSSVVCVDPELGGQLAAELMARFVPPGARTAVVTGMLQTADHRKKAEGFSSRFPQYCEGGAVVDVVEGHEDENETFEKCMNVFAQHPDITGLYVNTVLCLPVCYALKASGLAGKVRLITTDLFKEMVPFFENQTIHASIYQRPYVQGQSAIRLIAEHAFHRRPIPSTYFLGPAIVMRSNLYLFRETRHMRQLPGQLDSGVLGTSLAASGGKPDLGRKG
jgi:LacI family transcriptional regulator, galactose operon repressor